MNRVMLATFLCVAALAGCGATSGDEPCLPSCGARQCGPDGCGATCGECGAGATCAAGQCLAVCAPACGGRECGDDGCGGSCGRCGTGSACTAAGACVALQCPSPEQWCVVDEYTAYQYVCDYQPPPGTTTCDRLDAIGSYLSFDDCWTACAGGNSSCGDQHGGIDSAVAACLACVDSCVPSRVGCPVDPAAGCPAPCWCE
jgi:hypothetical protein